MKANVGDLAPAFCVLAPGDREVTLDEYRGGPLLLIFIRHLL